MTGRTTPVSSSDPAASGFDPAVRPASVGARLAAFTIDVVLSVALAVGAGSATGSPVLASVVLAELALGLWVLESRTGATPGNLLLGIRSARADAPFSPGAGRGLLRWAITGAGFLVAVVGAWLVVASGAFDPARRHRSWADRAAGTVVVGVARRRQREGAGAGAGTVAGAAQGVGHGASALPGPRLSTVGAPPGVTAVPAPAPLGVHQGGAHGLGAVPAVAVPPPSVVPGSAVPAPVPGVPGAALGYAAPPPNLGPPSATTAGPRSVTRTSARRGGHALPAQPAANPAPSQSQPAQSQPAQSQPAQPQVAQAPAHVPSGSILLVFDTGQREHLPVPIAVNLGRNPSPTEPDDLTIVVDDPESTVSKTHVRLEHERGRTWITDQGSTNGTSIRRDEVGRIELAHGDRVLLDEGDRIRIGNRNFTVSVFLDRDEAAGGTRA